MLQPRPRERSEIHYILISESPEYFVPFVPPAEFQQSIIGFVRHLPMDLLQIGQALDYYENRSRLALNNPYRFQVIYSQNLPVLLEHFPTNVLVVFLIDCRPANLAAVAAALVAAHSPLRYYKLFNGVANTGLDPAYLLETPADYLKALWDNKEQILELMGLPPLVFTPEISLSSKEIFQEPLFAPARSNYHITNSLTGNFQYPGKPPKYQTEEEARQQNKQEVTKAIEAAGSFERLDQTVLRIRMVDHFAQLCHDNDLIIPSHQIDAHLAPMLLVLPFQNPDVKFNKIKDATASMEATYRKALNFEQSPNYINQGIADADPMYAMIRHLTAVKIDFLDQMACLHASFCFSPVLRMPNQGKSIYRELSFFKPEALRVISKPANRKNIHKTIRNFSKVLASRVLSDKLSKDLIHKNRQLVAITDLPIEWLETDGIPLGFSHDVCRLPETALHGLMANFARNELLGYTVPKDILKKTLVIFGSEDTAFKKWRAVVNGLAASHGFQTRVCKTVSELKTAVETIKPELLIFDCHGGVDEKSRTSFLLLEKEKLTGELIVKHGITAPLVFLSACSTAPNYGTINTIANAFFEVGALSVTTTYMPIYINSGSLLYIRLLNNLKTAAAQAIHPNWLSFLSHNIRTSVVSEVFKAYGRQSGLTNEKENELAAQQAELYTRLMVFSERRKVFNEMDAVLKGLSGAEQHNFASIVPEYLFYSNLGRSDLIRFESHLESFREKNGISEKDLNPEMPKQKQE